MLNILQMSDSVNELATSLSKMQIELINPIKGTSGYNYKYADLASYLNVMRKPLFDHNLAISQLLDSSTEGEFYLNTLLMHASGQWLKSSMLLKIAPPPEEPNKKGYNEMQALGSAISYARRYSLAAIVGLAQEDDDAQSSNVSFKKKEGTFSQKLVEKKPDFSSMGKEELYEEMKRLCAEHGIIDIKKFAGDHHLSSENLPHWRAVLADFKNYVKRA